MTLQNLNKILDRYESELGFTTLPNQFELLKGLPCFNWIETARTPGSFYSQNVNTNNTFNHAIGLPQKNGQPMPLFDYEQLLYNVLTSNKHLWIKKATGLGVTEFMLRYMAWLCLR